MVVLANVYMTGTKKLADASFFVLDFSYAGFLNERVIL